MAHQSTLGQAWHTLWELRTDSDASTGARLLLISLLALALTIGLMVLAAMVGTIEPQGWWKTALLPSFGICLCILHAVFGVLQLGGRLLPARLVERMADLRDLRAGLALALLAFAGIVLGLAVSFTAVPSLAGFEVRDLFKSVPVALAKIALFLLLAMGANWARWRARLRQQQLRSEALDARLRLLQGQIEPHMLFNTLANVQSLMDYDPARAKRMLETFSSYLRAGLSQLRQTESTLEQELEMAHAYLSVLQIRMADRLHFHIDAGDEARGALMPTLLLQPLIENAIQHGIEPQLHGGSVIVSARVYARRLEVRVVDDGMGLEGPSRSLRPGAGIALANLRARLHTRFGAAASLTLRSGVAGGTEAVLDMPLEMAR